MPATNPLRCAYSAMSSFPTGHGGTAVVLLDTGNYPSYSNYLNETWTWSGTNWTNTGTTLINAAGPLPGRINFCMSFDGTNIMLYGGQGGSSTTGVLEDTWVYNGTVWTQIGGPTPPGPSLAVQPFGRYNAEATYIGSNKVVMFGGQNTLYNLLEVWIWNGSSQTWSQVSVANGTGPAARIEHCFVGNKTSSAVLFGGQGTNSQFNDTWSFNGSSWTQLTPTNPPSVRSNASMCYDTTNNIWVMFGGENEYGYLVETWTLNSAGTAWTQVSVPNGTGPAGVIGAQMEFDPQSGTSILFGGISGGVNYPSNQTWSFNGSSLKWTQL